MIITFLFLDESKNDGSERLSELPKVTQQGAGINSESEPTLGNSDLHLQLHEPETGSAFERPHEME